MYNSNSNSNFMNMLKQAYPPLENPNKNRATNEPKLNVITFPKGRVLWHARLQWDDEGPRKNVMNSPDYLFTSPQISQALLHGVSILGSKQGRFIELTKLKVKESLRLLEFKTSKNQVNYSSSKGINLKPFGVDDIKLIQYICSSVPDIDGYRAVWDQDQVTVCASVIKKKLERISRHVFRRGELPFGSWNVAFNTPASIKHAMYYFTMGSKKPGRRLTRSVKLKEKENAAKRKILRTRTFGIGKKTGAGGGTSVKTGTVFKRPVLRKKK